jgi:hypothetical protein
MENAMSGNDKMAKVKKGPPAGVLETDQLGNIYAGVTPKRTGYRVYQESGLTKVRQWHNEGYPVRRYLGYEVDMPKKHYDLASLEGMAEFSQDFLKIFMKALGAPPTEGLPAKGGYSGKLNKEVFVIDYETRTVVTTTCLELFHLVSDACRPEGIGTKYYATQTLSDSEQWAVATYSTGREHCFQFTDTEEEAISAVEDIWIEEIFNHQSEVVYVTFEQAQESLTEFLEELDD